MEALVMDKEEDGVDESFPPRRRRPRTIPDLLAAREWGVSPSYSRVSPSCTLSSAVAWNTNRMNNMILAVGPGTPAAEASSRKTNESQDDESEEQAAFSSSEDEDTMSQDHHHHHAQDEDSENEEMQESTTGNENGDAGESTHFQRDLYLGAGVHSSDLVERIVLEYLEQHQQDESDEDSGNEEILREEVLATTTGNLVSSIRHGGCINTATWLTSPWRLSTGSNAAVESTDCPTQLITSGDDRTVKFWDVRHAMGSAIPYPGGKYSQTPFADTYDCEPFDWEQAAHDDLPLAGSVIPLVSLATGHRCNVFHVTPCDAHPGKVLTCAADGYLRMADVNRPDDTSTVIFSPEYALDHFDDMLPIGLFALRSSHMCFSHHFINANTGLLCGEHGLYRFDLRLSAREQSSTSLLGNDDTCKSCAIWSAPSGEEVDSAYVFAGGASSEVALYDLRMTGDGSRIVQKYRPSGLTAVSEVSVSGLDVSKDKRELLVSYENDQIFSFPVFPFTSGGHPSVDELGEYSSSYNKEVEEGPVLSELAAYGGHLNRFTFLKNAKYAGPNDEYICTGSDSGRAWFYDRATGTVAAFLAADESTCNGVIPHPSLPFFITYGIDSTAKIWRATPPVDRDTDDSPLGRARQYHRHEYEKSSLIRSWAYSKAMSGSIATLEEEESEPFTIFPDQIPVSDSPTGGSSLLGGILMRRRMFGGRGMQHCGICNDLRELPVILQKNLFSCVIASEEGESEPVSSGLADLSRRMSTIRLRFQADQRGLAWNANEPWVFRSRDTYNGEELQDKSSGKTDGKRENATRYGNAFDLVPDSPCDWIPYDPDMTKNPRPAGPRFNKSDYGDFYGERYSDLDSADRMQTTSNDEGTAWTKRIKHQGGKAAGANDSPDLDETIAPYDAHCALSFLHDTAIMLKEGGNAALEAGSVMEAARRYDCAIRYCSVALLMHPNANEDFLLETEKKWCPIRKLLVTCRLNLCLVLSNFDVRGSREQAMLALKELAPFCTQSGKVLTGKKLALVHKENEPTSTYEETKELQAKAYFRLGSVSMKVGDYDEAVDKFEESIKCSKELSKEPDRVLLRRLAEAKREKARKSKRQKKKFKRTFDDWEGLCPPTKEKEEA